MRPTPRPTQRDVDELKAQLTEARALLREAKRHLRDWADDGFLIFSNPVETEEAHDDLLSRLDAYLNPEEQTDEQE